MAKSHPLRKNPARSESLRADLRRILHKIGPLSERQPALRKLERRIRVWAFDDAQYQDECAFGRTFGRIRSFGNQKARDVTGLVTKCDDLIQKVRALEASEDEKGRKQTIMDTLVSARSALDAWRLSALESSEVFRRGRPSRGYQGSVRRVMRELVDDGLSQRQAAKLVARWICDAWYRYEEASRREWDEEVVNSDSEDTSWHDRQVEGRFDHLWGGFIVPQTPRSEREERLTERIRADFASSVEKPPRLR